MDFQAFGRHLRPLRVFVIASLIGLALGILLHLVFQPLLDLLQQALFYRITKPLEIIQGPLSGVLGTEEAVTAVYLLFNNLFVSVVAAFGGLVLAKYTMRRDEVESSGQSRTTSFLHRLIGEGNARFKEHSTIVFLLPLAVVFVNGVVLGLFSVGQSLSWRELVVYAAYILPHGIIEIPAVIVAAGIGYYHALKVNRFLDSDDLSGYFDSVDRLLRSRRSWAMFGTVTLMIVSAAVIETYVTPAFGRRALQRAYFEVDFLNDTYGPGETAVMVVYASYGATVEFRSGSPTGTPIPVPLTGNERFPFEVDGETVEDGERVVASRLTIPEDLPALAVRIGAPRANATLVIFAIAELDDLRSEANVTFVP